MYGSLDFQLDKQELRYQVEAEEVKDLHNECAFISPFGSRKFSKHLDSGFTHKIGRTSIFLI